MYTLLGDLENEVTIEDQALGPFSIRHIIASHVATIEAYGFWLKIDHKQLYYSRPQTLMEELPIMTMTIMAELKRLQDQMVQQEQQPMIRLDK